MEANSLFGLVQQKLNLKNTSSKMEHRPGDAVVTASSSSARLLQLQESSSILALTIQRYLESFVCH